MRLAQLSDDVLSLYPYNFSQNGLVAYKDGALIGETTINTFLGEVRGTRAQ